MNHANATAVICAAPLRSEAFVEDLPETDNPAGVESPWWLRDAGLAALLCALPVLAAALGGIASLAGAF